MRLFFVILCLTLAFLTPLFFFGDTFDIALSGDEAIGRLENFGHWAWAIGIGLIVADLVLPIPATAVMAAMGYLYGALVGGIISAVASMMAGLIAFFATRLIGHRAAVFIVGARDLERVHSFFVRNGGFAVAISRPLPLLPEVVACLAGLARMPARRFTASLVCGSLPTGFAYAAIGAMGVDRPAIALGVGCIVPVVLWAIVQRAAFAKGAPSETVEASEVDLPNES